ncbi:plasmid mobilization protein [Lichenifustis flavocetrariae]|uniref:Plasmid mobilization relaxosome protein MobC n=1 Tax=Lichenifustis flavocetrariae TaxID=2949735 RepID=A0AA42CRA2_9HYPH|nr:plasmid mobilization relaxosome protein MobC [Lichenifustis flavocetrariae]MCW6512272.1 plasmid mobilization relaxosome protein MobC [Lichenifustis flavocetrariae]
MARPRLAPEDRRGHPTGIRLNLAEEAKIDAAASAYGLSRADYLRRRGLNHRLPSTVALAHSEALLATALLRLGVNLNQIAHHMNAGRAAPHAELDALIARINECLDQLYDPGPDGAGA